MCTCICTYTICSVFELTDSAVMFGYFTDVLTILTNLEVEVLADESSTEAERQAALREVREAFLTV